MGKRKQNKFIVVGIVLIIFGVISILISICSMFFENLNTLNEVDRYLELTSSKDNSNIVSKSDDEEILISDEKETFLVLEIPKIKLKRNIFNFESKYNDVEYNIEILDDSNTPDVANGNTIFASHNGNSKVSFFNKLYRLDIGDEIYIYYAGIKYVYKLSKVYDIEKDGIAELYRDKEQSSVTLITCKKNIKDKQEVYIAYLTETYVY